MDRTFYQSGLIAVDENFARFGNKSFAVDKINSVEVRTEEAKNPALAVFVIMAIICGIVFLSDPTDSFVALGLTLLFGFLTYNSWKNPPKDKHRLFLMTSSSEAQAFETTDRDEVTRLRDAIENAMVSKNRRIGD